VRAARPLAAGLALCATLGALAGPAMALRLSMDRAGDCSLDFAERTCTRDKHCVRFGVLNCRRQSRHVVLCRIFDERRTPVQGKYRCERLIRLSLEPRNPAAARHRTRPLALLSRTSGTLYPHREHQLAFRVELKNSIPSSAAGWRAPVQLACHLWWRQQRR
jgi:hypothetical protein